MAPWFSGTVGLEESEATMDCRLLLTTLSGKEVEVCPQMLPNMTGSKTSKNVLLIALQHADLDGFGRSGLCSSELSSPPYR